MTNTININSNIDFYILFSPKVKNEKIIDLTVGTIYWVLSIKATTITIIKPIVTIETTVAQKD